MTAFIVITAYAWMNESGHGTRHDTDWREHPTIRRASSAGMRSLGHDDFLIGLLNGDALVSVTDGHGEALDWETSDYEEVASHLHIPWVAS